MTFYDSMISVLFEIKICSYKGPNTFHTTQQEISNKSSHFFDIYKAVEEMEDDTFQRTDKIDKLIALFLDEMKNKINNDNSEITIFENLPNIIDLDSHHIRKTAYIVMSFIQEKFINL